jgi:putative endonuclease
VGEYWVYILKCSDGSFYTGCTNDLTRRLADHMSGRASKYTRSRLPVSLSYAEPATDRGSALSREAQIKSLTRKGKIQLCESYQTKKKHKVR